MKAGQSRRESPVSVAGMVYGQRDLVNAMRELGIGPAPVDKSKLTMAAIILAAISPILTILGGGYFMTSFWRGEDERARAATTVTLRLDAGEKDRADLRYGNDQLRGRIEAIERDRAARIAAWETRVDKLEQSVRRLDLVEDGVTRQGKTLEAFGEKLNSGKEDRVRDINSLTEAQTAIRLELNGVKVELGFIRRALEARGRSPESPFGENQALPWSGRLPPYGLRASLDATNAAGEP